MNRERKNSRHHLQPTGILESRNNSEQQRDVQIPLAQRRGPALALEVIERTEPDRNSAMARAYATGAYSYQQIAQHFGVHFTTVGRVVRGG